MKIDIDTAFNGFVLPFQGVCMEVGLLLTFGTYDKTLVFPSFVALDTQAFLCGHVLLCSSYISSILCFFPYCGRL